MCIDALHDGIVRVPSTKSGKKFSYAEAAKSAATFVILSKEGKHLAKKYFTLLQEACDKEIIGSLQKGEDPPSIEKWTYSTTMATISFQDKEFYEKLSEVVNDNGFCLEEYSEFLNKRRPTTILSGLIKEPTAKQPREILELLITHQTKVKQIPGLVEFYSEHVTAAGNKILRIRVDDEAFERFKQVNCELQLAAAGKVLFQEAKSASSKTQTPKSEQITKRLSELQAKIEEDKAQIAKLEQERDEAAMAESAIAMTANDDAGQNATGGGTSGTGSNSEVMQQ